ncbi:MAG: CinA family protein [Actinomycetota bacterium]
MTPDERLQLVTDLHDHPARLVLAVAGGGNALITDLLDVPGASRTVLEVLIPYASSAMANLVGPMPRGVGAVSERMARAMALACRQRAAALEPGVVVVGLAVTAALVSDRPKRGEHRAHVVVDCTDGAGQDRHRLVRLVKGELDRPSEDRVVADAALWELGLALGLVS